MPIQLIMLLWKTNENNYLWLKVWNMPFKGYNSISLWSIPWQLFQFARVLGKNECWYALVLNWGTMKSGLIVRQSGVITVCHCVDRCIREVREAFNNFKEVAKTCHWGPVLRDGSLVFISNSSYVEFHDFIDTRKGYFWTFSSESIFSIGFQIIAAYSRWGLIKLQ